MQASPPERARFLHVVVGLLVVGLVGGTGCTNQGLPPGTYSPFGTIDTIASSEVPRDSVLAVLDRMDRTAFDSAFAQLDAYAVTRYVRTERMDTTGAITAYRTLTLRYPPDSGAGTIQRADSAGTFREGGLLSSIAPAQQRTARPANLALQALADQPAYLAPRTQEDYRYALGRDSLLDGTPAFVVEAKVRSDGRGTDQDIQYARLTIDRASHELVGLTTVRTSRVLLFRERSQLTLHLRPSPDDAWVPHLTRFRAFVDIPFRAARQFRTVSAYYGYDARNETP
ncbi:MAG: hypothetical protein ABEL51_07995 [Salinibacter sp.]